MEPSEFTKKCQLAEETLREVVKDIDEDNEDVYWRLWDAINILSNLAIPEGQFIGRSAMKCLFIEAEDECNSLEYGKETLDSQLREIRLLFDAMDELGITRMNKEVFESVQSIDYDEEELARNLTELDEDKGNDFKERIEEICSLKSCFKRLIEEIMQARPDYFEMGKPESEITCDESCRGTEEVIQRDASYTVTTRPDKCLYKDWL